MASPRHRGETALHRLQKTNSRKRILDAAQALLSELSYVQTTVEQIAARAKVTKITFYRHFSGKFDVANAVMAQGQPPLLNIFSTLGKSEHLDQAQIRVWLDEVVSHFERGKVFLSVSREIAAIERQHRGYLFDFYTQAVEELSKGIPEFVVASRTDLGMARAILLVRQTLQVCFDLVLYDEASYRESFLTVVAEQFAAFLDDMREESGGSSPRSQGASA
jgi:AcrR family transcriptional regulator